MVKDVCQVTVGSETLEYPRGTAYRVIADALQKNYRYPIVLVTVDGRLRELHKRLDRNCTLNFVPLAEDIGHKTYQRSLTLLML